MENRAPSARSATGCQSMVQYSPVNERRRCAMPFGITRRSQCHFTARDSTCVSTSRPAATRSSGSEVVVDPGHVLLDDRPLVQVVVDVVRGRADQLHAAVVRLVVRLGALEAGQERVVDVDRPAGQGVAGRPRQHLHVAGQHHQVDAVLVDQIEHLPLGRRLGVRRDREVHVRDVVRRRQRREIVVVGDDDRDLDVRACPSGTGRAGRSGSARTCETMISVRVGVAASTRSNCHLVQRRRRRRKRPAARRDPVRRRRNRNAPA